MRFSCPDGAVAVVVVEGYDVAACAAGQGTWVAEGGWWEQSIASEDFGALLSAAALVLVMAWGFAFVRRLMF